MDLPLRKMIDIPPVWLAIMLALVWAQGRFVPLGPEPGPWLRLAGAALILGGLGLMALAIVEFRRHRTTVVPHQQPAQIVTSGVFAVSRNPIYLGDTMILAGCALRWHAYPALLLVPVFMALIN